MDKRMQEYVEDAVDQAEEWYDGEYQGMWSKYEYAYRTCEYIKETAKSMLCLEMNFATTERELKELEEYDCTVDDEAYRYYYKLLKENGIIKDYEFDQNGCMVYLYSEMGKVEVYRRIQDEDNDTREYVCFRDGKVRDGEFVDQRGNYRYEYVGDYEPGDVFYTYYVESLNFESGEFDDFDEMLEEQDEFCEEAAMEHGIDLKELMDNRQYIEYQVTDKCWNDDDPYYVASNEVVCAEVVED